MQTNEPLISKLRLDILVENSSFKSKFLAEHGLSVLIEAATEDDKKFLLLFDISSTGNPIINNLKVLEKEKSFLGLDGIVLSHGHYDHTGSLEAVLEQAPGLRIYGHPDIFDDKFSYRGGRYRPIGIPFNRDELEQDAVFILSPSPINIIPGIMTTGEIPRETAFESNDKHFFII